MATHFVVDVEADGPVVGLYSMVALGAVALRPQVVEGQVVLNNIGEYLAGPIQPMSTKYDPAHLAYSGYTREQQLAGLQPHVAIQAFYQWMIGIANGEPCVFWSDNPTFDGQWVSHLLLFNDLPNPFGYSGRRIGDVFAGVQGSLKTDWRRHRKTPHDHNPLNDARGNAEALQYLAPKVSGW